MIPLRRVSQKPAFIRSRTNRAAGPAGFRFRRLRADDKERLQEFYRFLDEDTLYSRFACLGQGIIDAEVDLLVNQIALQGAGIVATLSSKIVGVGYYCAGEEPNTAEVAFIVNRRYRHHGIATFLLRRLERDIRRRGFAGITAQVECANAPMKEVFQDVLGKPQKTASSYGQLTYGWSVVSRDLHSKPPAAAGRKPGPARFSENKT
jgi:GNAT superfamily N-acetyltransferase